LPLRFDDRSGNIITAVRQFHMIYNGTSYVSERMPVLRQNLKQLFAAGVPIVAGTDTGFPGVIAGVSSLMEPVLHVQAGLSPQAALQAATINAARMVNREKEMGTVEAGKLADLLLLDDRQVKAIKVRTHGLPPFPVLVVRQTYIGPARHMIISCQPTSCWSAQLFS
jgi:predicted amidohydrolase YtcJ